MIKPLEECAGSNYQDYLDYKIIDKNGEDVGALYSMWSDQSTGRFEFLGFKTGWLVGKNHIMPVTGVGLDDEAKFVQVPYTVEFLKDAPAFAAEAEITAQDEDKIRAHYQPEQP